MSTKVEHAPDVQTPVRRSITLAELWAFASVALPVLAALEASISTVDLAYHLRAGDVMLRTHHLIRTDSFSFTAAGRPWLDQQWGAQILLELVNRVGGWVGLAFFRAALVGLIFLFVYLGCRVSGAWIKRAAWLTLAAFGISLGGLALRPQLFAMALFPLTAWLIAGRRAHPGRLWWIPAIVAVWANLHGSFFLGPLLLGLAYLEDRRRKDPAARRTLSIGVVSALAATVNPFGLKVWSYAVGISTNSVITQRIQEWTPPTIRDGLGAVFFLSIGLVAVALARRRAAIPWTTLLSLGLFAAIGLYAIRGVFWWALIGPVIMAELFADTPPRKPDLGRPNLLNVAFVVVIVALGVAVNPALRPTYDEGTRTPVVSDAPMKLTAALRGVVGPGERVFNAQILGSWLEYAMPANPITVDSRIEVFPSTVWQQYLEVSAGQEGWQAVLDRWQVQAVIADPSQQGGLLPRIRRDTGWRQVYRDADGAVFVRTAPPPASSG